MNEKSHAEMEKYHYQALKNPQYQLEGMMDVLREELMMSLPEPSPEPKVKPFIRTTFVSIDPRTLELDKRLRKAEVTLKGISNYLKSSARRKLKGEYY